MAEFIREKLMFDDFDLGEMILEPQWCVMKLLNLLIYVNKTFGIYVYFFYY